jgi:DNA-binding CsgD family transcriptional regulator
MLAAPPVSEATHPTDCITEALRTSPLSILRQLVESTDVPILGFDLSANHACFGNAALAKLMALPWPVPSHLWRTEIQAVVAQDVAEQMRQGLQALRTGALQSYQSERTYEDCNGRPIRARHTATRVDLCEDPSMALIIVSPITSGGSSMRLKEPPEVCPPAFVTLSHSGDIEAASPDANLELSSPVSDLIGSSMMSRVHADDRRMLARAQRTAAEMRLSAFRIRVGDKARGWQDMEVLAGPLCNHNPARMGLLLTKKPLDRRLDMPSRAGISAPLTGQQRAVVDYLLQGCPIPVIATELHLSRSTVRNHLSAVYAKVGVHSQTELIAVMTGRRAHQLVR